jgi:hypothetical protein
MKTKSLFALCFILLSSSFILSSFAQGTAFTYQGRMNDGANPAAGIYDLRFAIYDSLTAGARQGNFVTNSAVSVSNGLFTVTLDFGAGIFTGPARWMEIAVRSGAIYTNLVPRQPVTPTPYAIYSGGATASGLSGQITGSQIAAGSIGPTQIASTVGLWTRSGNDISYSAGKVGIGTATPAAGLHVMGSGFFGDHSGSLSASAGAGVRIFRDTTTGVGHIYAYDYATSSSTNLILQQPGGNVGIGTTTPTTKLQVAGEITTVAVNITSDRNAKEQFKPVNARDVLDRVARLPISEWQYKESSDARHIGPMAQDFHATFALGRDDKHIATVDADGVALAAIQGLNQKLDEQLRDKERRIQELERAVEQLRELLNSGASKRNEVHP